jgi:hypothetical protein
MRAPLVCRFVGLPFRWSAVSLVEGRETMWLRRAIRKTTGGLVEGDLKTHQQRRVALDAETASDSG